MMLCLVMMISVIVVCIGYWVSWFCTPIGSPHHFLPTPPTPAISTALYSRMLNFVDTLTDFLPSGFLLSESVETLDGGCRQERE